MNIKQMVTRLFNLDLHISVIKDIQDVCNRLYGDSVEITNWSISGHNWVFGAPTAETKWITPQTWKHIDINMIQRFQEEYDDYLKSFDGFIVTHTPVFAMLYEKYNKPILIVNTCRFDQPFCWKKNDPMYTLFTESLRRMVANKQAMIVSNNRGDMDYLFNKTAIQSQLIPSLCLYTKSRYTPTTNDYIVYGTFQKYPYADNLRPRPDSGYTWSDLFNYKGIIHEPYEMSTMSIFEQYWAGIPLFFPSKQFYKDCILENKMGLQSNYETWGEPYSPEEIDWWLERADFYNMPYIQYYDSFEDAVQKIQVWEDTQHDERLAYLDQKIQEVLDTWKPILDDLVYNVME